MFNMKIRNILFAVMLSITSVSLVAGCSLFDQGVKKYDTLVDKDEICNQTWSNYESQLQRRADLIPSLVAVVKGSAAHESKTLKEVIEARASATQIKLTADDLTNPEKMAAFQKAQDQLKGSLSRLMMVQETYPDLKANAQFHGLMIQIEGTENRILRARQEYNKAVQDYNLELRRISGKAINPLTNMEFKPRVYFQADASAKTAPTVDFTPPASVSK
jgi:LemA protein